MGRQKNGSERKMESIIKSSNGRGTAVVQSCSSLVILLNLSFLAVAI